MGQTPSYLKSLKKESVVQSVINCLTDAIRSRELQPGDKIPPEPELAESLGVARSSVREAIKILTYPTSLNHIQSVTKLMASRNMLIKATRISMMIAGPFLTLTPPPPVFLIGFILGVSLAIYNPFMKLWIDVMHLSTPTAFILQLISIVAIDAIIYLILLAVLKEDLVYSFIKKKQIEE